MNPINQAIMTIIKLETRMHFEATRPESRLLSQVDCDGARAIVSAAAQVLPAIVICTLNDRIAEAGRWLLQRADKGN